MAPNPNRAIRIFFVNIRSLKANDWEKCVRLEELFDQWNVDVAVIAETYLQNEGDVLTLSGKHFRNFVSIHSCRRRENVQKCGGVSVFLRRTSLTDQLVLKFGSGIIYDQSGTVLSGGGIIDNHHFSYLYVTATRNLQNFNVIAVYTPSKHRGRGPPETRPPNHNLLKFLTHLRQYLQQYESEQIDLPCIAVGDFNLNFMNVDFNLLGQGNLTILGQYYNLMSYHHFTLRTRIYPTRIQSGKLIDHVWSRSIHQCAVSNVVVEAGRLADHNILVTDLIIIRQKNQPQEEENQLHTKKESSLGTDKHARETPGTSREKKVEGSDLKKKGTTGKKMEKKRAAASDGLADGMKEKTLELEKKGALSAEKGAEKKAASAGLTDEKKEKRLDLEKQKKLDSHDKGALVHKQKTEKATEPAGQSAKKKVEKFDSKEKFPLGSKKRTDKAAKSAGISGDKREKKLDKSMEKEQAAASDDLSRETKEEKLDSSKRDALGDKKETQQAAGSTGIPADKKEKDSEKGNSGGKNNAEKALGKKT